MSAIALNTAALRRISTLEEHRALLTEVIRTAKNRVLIVSPFISASAVKADGLAGEIRRAVARGVKVSIYTDRNLNRDAGGRGKPSADDGIADLLQAGAQVTVVDGIHNKTLGRDNDLITEGSFNWLSAVRTMGAVHQREERTIVIGGEGAGAMIQEELTKINTKAARDEKLFSYAADTSGKPSRTGLGGLLVFFFLVLLCFVCPTAGAISLALTILWLLFLPTPKKTTGPEEVQKVYIQDTKVQGFSFSDDPGPIYGPGELGSTGVHFHVSAWPDGWEPKQ